MASFEDYTVERGGVGQPVVPTHTIRGKVYEGTTLLYDGVANPVTLPAGLLFLPPEIQDEFAAEWGPRVLRAMAGLTP